MITELSYCHCAGIQWPGTGGDFRDQSYYGLPRSILVRVLFNGTDVTPLVMISGSLTSRD